jgi:DNA-binding transcriptional MocR family regulator
MKIVIEQNAETSLANQVEQGVRMQIERRELRAGTRLPSIRRLAAELSVSRNTVIEAYDRLVAQGLVRSRQGSGYFVDELAPRLVSVGGWSNLREAEEVYDRLWRMFSEQGDSLKLGCGWLPEHWRDTAEFTYAVRKVARQDQTNLFDYSTPLGNPGLRQHLQRRFRGMDINVHAHQILLTTGASHGLDLLIRHLLNPGDVVFVEAPGYYNLIGLLKLQGIQIVGIRQTAHGPDIDALEEMLTTCQPRLFFVNSVFQNPTGTTLSVSIAHQILQLAERFDFLVIEDDVYADFQSDVTLRLAALDQLRRVVYVGSFSKSLSCSLRVGFVAAAPEMIRGLVDVKMLTSIATSRFAEEVVSVMLNNGSYRQLTQRLCRRMDQQMVTTLRLLESTGWEVFSPPSGGMFIWVRWPGVSDSAVLVESAEHRRVSLSSGSAFHSNMGDCPWFRINVTYATDPRAIAFITDPLQHPA